MTKIRGTSQIQDKSIKDRHIDPTSILGSIQLTNGSGDTTFSRDANGNVSSLTTSLPEGDTRLTNFIRDSSQSVIRIEVSFQNSPVLKIYNILRDVSGQVTGIDEV
jgi:hypothetical protein